MLTLEDVTAIIYALGNCSFQPRTPRGVALQVKSPAIKQKQVTQVIEALEATSYVEVRRDAQGKIAGLSLPAPNCVTVCQALYRRRDKLTDFYHLGKLVARVDDEDGPGNKAAMLAIKAAALEHNVPFLDSLADNTKVVAPFILLALNAEPATAS